MVGVKYDQIEILLANIADRVGLIMWMLSKDGNDPTKRPTSLVESMLGRKENPQGVRGFNSKEELDKALAEFL